MRLIVFFDLPVDTSKDRKNYRKFRKFLLTNGYIMMQESVYSKLCLNASVVESALKALKKNKPPKGMVQALEITERQYAGMNFIVGEHTSEFLDSDERLVILWN